MAGTWRQRLFFTGKLIVSIGLLYLLFRQVPATDLKEAFLQADWWIVFISCFVMGAGYYLNSLQMYWMTHVQTLGLTVNRIFAVNLISRFYELFLPTLIAGGAIRWYHFSKVRGRPAEALAAIVVNRLLETALLLVMGLLFWALDRKGVDDQVVVVSILALTVVSVAMYAALFHAPVHRGLSRLWMAMPLPAWVLEKGQKVLKAIAVYEGETLGFHVRVLLVAVLRLLVTLYALYMLALALNLAVSFEAMGWIRTIVTFAMLIPIAISGFGVRELTFVALLAPYGVSVESALVLSLLMFGRGLLFALMGGVIEAHRVWGKRNESGIESN